MKTTCTWVKTQETTCVEKTRETEVCCHIHILIEKLLLEFQNVEKTRTIPVSRTIVRKHTYNVVTYKKCEEIDT